MNAHQKGFTIVELLIVIVVIAILAAISVVAYNGVQTRAKNAKRDNDLTQLEKAIQLARTNTSKQTVAITGFGMTSYNCTVAGGNTNNTEPRLLAQNHSCWTSWRTMLDRLSTASGMNLSGLYSGDASGNPYYLNENDGESNGGNYCSADNLGYFTGSGANATAIRNIPSERGSNCTS